ncbi:unnamed protein product [Jaminaea pallidilutea]
MARENETNIDLIKAAGFNRQRETLLASTYVCLRTRAVSDVAYVTTPALVSGSVQLDQQPIGSGAIASAWTEPSGRVFSPANPRSSRARYSFGWLMSSKVHYREEDDAREKRTSSRPAESEPQTPGTASAGDDGLSEEAILKATSIPPRARTPTPGTSARRSTEDRDEDEGEENDDEDEEAPVVTAADLQRKGSRGLTQLLRRKRSSRHHVRGQRREKAKMVGQQLHDHLHHAFRGWFRDTESDGTPILPTPLSKKYNVQSTVLGQGSFAVVKEIEEKATGEKRALKIIAKRPLKENSEKMLKEEIKILGKVEHPNVIKMWDLYETKEGVFIVTDLCRGGELFDRLVEKVHYNELDARHIIKQVFQGVAYLHDHDVIHRDLKPENILLRDKSDPSDIVISDFGLSRFIPEEGLLMTACGSPQYVSPEVLLGRGYGSAVDIWSSGVIAYCLLAGYTPFYGEDQPTLFQEIVKMKVEFEEQYWHDISSTAKDFILHCLCPAEKRMTAKDALKHPWLADLPELHVEEHRGACLKDRALKNLTAQQKVTKAVTAIEAVNYLKRLHVLRQEHSADDIPAGELSRLLKAATHLHLSSTEQDLANDEVREERADDIAASQETIKTSGSSLANDSNEKSDRKNDSAMSIDLVVMPSFGGRPSQGQGESLPQRGNPGTDAMTAAIDASGGGVMSAPRGATDHPPRPSRSASIASEKTARPSSPGAESVSSEATTRPSNSNGGTTRSGGSTTKRSGFHSALTSMLDQYRGQNVPQSARTDVTAEPVERQPMTIAKAWQYLPFLVSQGITIGSAVASHAIYGPPKKSWGIEMSVFTRLLRETASYTQFATVDGMQKFFELASFLPVPKDGLITPVTFKVKKRGLKGFLADVDAAEDGSRELTGEWVVGKQTWRRLQAEWRGGKAKGTERVILYIHGGAYFVMSAVTHRPVTISLSKYTECRVFAVNYRLAPGCKFPGPLHDIVASWFRLTDDLGIPASNIVLGADSAGGGLACALMYYLRDNGYPLPSGAILFSPWVDLTMSCDSWDTNAPFDYLVVPGSHDHMNPVRAYLGDNLEKYLTHPYASPLFGDMRGLPPLLIQCGDAECLRDEVTLLAHKASLAGVPVRHELYEDCVHVFQAFLFLDASRKALQSARHFVRTALDKRTGGRRSEVTQNARQQMDKEMKENMGNSNGEKVEPRTGVTRGSWKEGRSESDTEAGDSSLGVTSSSGRRTSGATTAAQRVQGSKDSKTGGVSAADDGGEGSRSGAEDSDEEWELHRRGSGDASRLQPARLAASALGVGDDDVTKMEDEDIAADKTGAAKTQQSRHREPQSAPPAAAAASTTSGRPTSSSSSSSSSSSLLPVSMSLEEAQQRAQAGMRAQESLTAPSLARFHDPTHSLRPKMKRGKSNAAIQDLMDQFEQAQRRAEAGERNDGGLHTRVFTPGSGGGSGGGGSGGSGQQS